jgi:hypothetical protein
MKHAAQAWQCFVTTGAYRIRLGSQGVVSFAVCFLGLEFREPPYPTLHMLTPQPQSRQYQSAPIEYYKGTTKDMVFLPHKKNRLPNRINDDIKVIAVKKRLYI